VTHALSEYALVDGVVARDAIAKQWFAVWTRSRCEASVQDQLLQKNFEVFLPTVTRWSRWKDRRKRIAFPLFRGYCFAKFAEPARFAVLASTGVAGIVSFCGIPAPVPDDEIEGIRRLVTSGVDFDPCPSIVEGQRVRVERGPLAGLVGRLVRRHSQARLVLSVELVGGAASVAVDADDVSPLT